MAADFDKPTVTSNYANFATEIRDMFEALSVMQNGITPSNIPDKAIRWNATDKRFEIYTLSTTSWATVPQFVVANAAALGTGKCDGELRICADDGNIYTYDNGNSKWRVMPGNKYTTANLPDSTYQRETGCVVYDLTAGCEKVWGGSSWDILVSATDARAFNEQSAPSTAVDQVKIYAKADSGACLYCRLENDGTEVKIIDHSLAALAVPFASGADVIAGISTTKAITPLALQSLTGTTDRDGLLRLAITTEINAATDTTRAMGIDEFAASRYGTKSFNIMPFATIQEVSTGDGQLGFCIPADMNGMNIIDCVASYTGTKGTGSSSKLELQIRRVRDGTPVDVLSVKLSIDNNEWNSTTAGTSHTISPTYDDLQEADLIFIDVDSVGETTPGEGLSVTISARMP